MQNWLQHFRDYRYRVTMERLMASNYHFLKRPASWDNDTQAGAYLVCFGLPGNPPATDVYLLNKAAQSGIVFW